MFKKFEAERRAVATEADKEIELEWESKLKDLIAMWEKNCIDEKEFQKVCAIIQGHGCYNPQETIQCVSQG